LQKKQYSAIPALFDGAAAFPQGHFLNIEQAICRELTGREAA
jgi:hypothetical protein